MGYLILAILSSLSISLLVKHNEQHGINSRVVLAANYISAALLGWGFVAAHGVQTLSRETLFLGLGGGVLWPGVFYLLMWGIRHYGVALAGAVSRLSLSVPVLFALLFLGERLSLVTALGIAGVLAAFLLLSPLRGQANHALDRRAAWYFPALVLSFGVVDVWVNLFNTLGPAEEKFLFVVLIFTAAGGFAWATLALQKCKVDAPAMRRGLLLGLPNFFSTYCLLEALRAPTFAGRSAIVYALYSVLGVTLAFVAGATLWKERVTRANVAGVAVAAVAITLLNLR